MPTELSFDEVFGATEAPTPRSIQKKTMGQTLDLFGGALRGLWNSTLGGVAQTGGSFLKHTAKAAADPITGGAGLTMAGLPAIIGAGKVIGEMGEGALAQGQAAADLMMVRSAARELCVIHAGEHSFPMGERIRAVPIARLLEGIPRLK